LAVQLPGWLVSGWLPWLAGLADWAGQLGGAGWLAAGRLAGLGWLTPWPAGWPWLAGWLALAGWLGWPAEPPGQGNGREAKDQAATLQ